MTGSFTSSDGSSEIKAVLDTNVLVSALTYPHGRVAPVWRAARGRRYQLLVSPAIISEVGKVLRIVFGWDEHRITNRLKLLSKTGEIIVPLRRHPRRSRRQPHFGVRG